MSHQLKRQLMRWQRRRMAVETSHNRQFHRQAQTVVKF